MKKIRVLIIDDSSVVRTLLSAILNTDPGIEVVGTASDPYVARTRIKELNPDVLTLDVEMPRMDGITFLRNLMRLHPMPVLMVSALTEDGATVTLEALELGAVDFVTKPKLAVTSGLSKSAKEIIEKVKVAAAAPVRALSERRLLFDRSGSAGNRFDLESKDVPMRDTLSTRDSERDVLIAIGASTGGTEAIKEILQQLPADSPAVVIVQHIPGDFSGPFAERMNLESRMNVAEAEEGSEIRRGHVFIAPGNRHLGVGQVGDRLVCRLDDGPSVNRHKPSVDVLFQSVAKTVGSKAIGVLLTGMGADGASGMLEMREMGAMTLAQDERTSLVWGMPRAAVECGAVEEVVPLQEIAAIITKGSRR